MGTAWLKIIHLPPPLASYLMRSLLKAGGGSYWLVTKLPLSHGKGLSRRPWFIPERISKRQFNGILLRHSINMAAPKGS